MLPIISTNEPEPDTVINMEMVNGNNVLNGAEELPQRNVEGDIEENMEENERENKVESSGDEKTEECSASNDPAEEPKGIMKIIRWLVNFYFKNDFLLNILLAIALAKAYPPLGAVYLHPEISSTWVAVMIIFGRLITQFRCPHHSHGIL